MAYGDALAASYQLPQNRYIGQQAPAQGAQPGAAPNLGLPSLNDNYANVQGTSDNFIDTVGQIESYALDMQKRYGIDVTQPDYSQSGGGQPFRTFQELTAKAIMTGNDLKQRATQNQLMDRGTIEGNWRSLDNQDQIPLGADISQRGYHIGLDPDVQAVVDRTRGSNFYTSPDAANYNTQVVRQKRNEWQKKADNAQSEPERKYAELQVAALTDAVKETYPGLLTAAAKAGAVDKNQVGFVKKVQSLMTGALPKGSYEISEDDNGNTVSVSKDFQGDYFGGGGYQVVQTKDGPVSKPAPKNVIQEWRTYPNGESYLVLKSEDGSPVDPIRVDNTSVGSVMQVLQSSNPKFGDASKMMAQLQQSGMMDETGHIPEQNIYGADHPVVEKTRTALYDQIKTANKNKQDDIAAVEKWLTTMETKPSAWKFWADKPIKSFPIGDQKIEIGKDGEDSYFINNPEDFESTSSPQKTTGLTLKEVIEKLKKNKFFNQFFDPSKRVNFPAPSAGGTKPTLTPGGLD